MGGVIAFEMARQLQQQQQQIAMLALIDVNPPEERREREFDWRVQVLGAQLRKCLEAAVHKFKNR